MITKKIFNLMLAFIFAFSLMGMPLRVSAQEPQPPPFFSFNVGFDTIQAWQWPPGSNLTVKVFVSGIETDTADYTTDGTVTGPFPPWEPSNVTFNLSGIFDIQPGYLVTVSDGFTIRKLIVRYLAVTSFDVQTDTIAGKADPGALIQVCVLIPDNCIPRYVAADSSGDWLANFHISGTHPDEQPTVDLQAASEGAAIETDEDGDSNTFQWHVPKHRIHAIILENAIEGLEWPDGATVTLTIEDPTTSKSPDYTASQVVIDSPLRFDLSNDFILLPGQVITMNDGSTTKKMVVSNLTVTNTDIAGDKLSGTASLNGELWVWVNKSTGPTVRHVFADGDGKWFADFSTLGVEPWEQQTTDILPGTDCGALDFKRDGNGAGIDGDGTLIRWYAPTNRPPALLAITAPVDPRQIDTSVNTTATFMDPDLNDTHTATWDWGDGSISAGVVNDTNQSINGSHVYINTGVYTVNVTVTDAEGESNQLSYSYIVVYDPDGCFVTGGGWIMSPVGAYTSTPSLTGGATFGFVSKYLKGANVPTGNTDFQFHVANLNFESTSYDWLVIAGSKAQYKGTGTINGAGEYGFLLTAVDGSPDKFRIKIWDKASGSVIYDNQVDTSDMADPVTVLGGGSIVIHK